jgi:tetratricopeptide (TPR) repeat protein
MSVFPSVFAGRLVLLLAATIALSGCESAEERAARFFASGMELLAAGDTDRALVEFRNVFQNDPLHREARLTYARVVRDRGNVGEAYSQFLRLVEQYPDDLEARVALAEMAIDGSDWDEARRHADAALKVAPDDPALAMVTAMLDYRAAMLVGNLEAAEAPVALARARLAENPGNLIARRIVVDRAVDSREMNSGDRTTALAEVKAAIAAHPGRIEFYMMGLRLLAEAGDSAATGAMLETMVERFPDNTDTRTLLIGWYLSERDLAGAEAFLRRLAAAPDAGLEGKLAVAEFLRRTQGPEAARAELDLLIAAEPETATFRALRAVIDFEAGRRAEAIAEMEALASAGGTGEEALNLKIALARMLIAENDVVGARVRVEEVLAADPGHAEALKLHAGWLIEGDRPAEAVVALRTALAAAPNDAELLTMMGEAHEREGARQLAGERYAMAVEVSGRGVAESLRYADFLMTENRIDAASAVLEDAIAVTPASTKLLDAMADLQLRQRDWNRAMRIVWQLRSIGTEDATAAARAIELQSLLAQGRFDETLALLGATAGPPDATGLRVQKIEVQLRAGRVDKARALVDEGLAETPDDPVLRYLSAGIHLRAGETAKAEALYRGLLAGTPAADRPLSALVALLQAEGRDAEAMTALDAALDAVPEAQVAQLLKAGVLEKTGDIEGAIAVYAALYATDSGNLVVANNLASLLSAHRPDPESLERAFTIARRLAASEVPAFQDTYGWIEYRRGNHAEALARLEPAAAGLPDDPLVQYHLGMTYHALGRTALAREALGRALELAGDSPLHQFAEARRVLEEMGGE